MEILLLSQGELNVGLVSTNNTRFATVLKKADLFVFPKRTGALPAQCGLRPGDGDYRFPFGALFTPDVKDEVLQKVFKVDQKMVDSIQKQFRKESAHFGSSCMRQMLWQDDCTITFNLDLGK